MASAKTRALVQGHALCVPLARSLTSVQRRRIRGHVRALLAWQRSLKGWREPAEAPDATPFVTVYADGILRGCFGSHEGGPGERLTRAFLRAMEDSRYGSVRPQERERLAVVVSYVRSIRPIDPECVHEQLAAGLEGVGVIKEGRSPVLLVPHVSRDLRAGPRQLLALLAKKSGLADWRDAHVFAVRTEDVVVRLGEGPAPAPLDARAAAAAWLARLVGPDGAIAFAIDARKRASLATGLMHHGRAAIVLRALEEHGGPRRAAQRARAWLEREIGSALRGTDVAGWPSEPAVAAGTLALAHMAGIDVKQALMDIARLDALARVPWHAAQVVAALGRDAPESLWRACTDDLGRHAWAPWTLLAARARGELDVADRAARTAAASIRLAAPYAGGCGVTEVPETAVTALVVEALDGLPSTDARRAATRGRAFLRGLQLLGESIPPQLDSELARGAFPASPVVIDLLRCDVVGHALLAMGLPARRPRNQVADVTGTSTPGVGSSPD
jgi:AMMECR1 domain-containing protein